MGSFTITTQTYFVDETGNHKEAIFRVKAEDKDEAYYLASKKIGREFEQILGGWAITKVEPVKRGGRRDKAGRPKSESTVRTIAKRVPENLNVQHAIEIKALLEDWKERANHGSGPRWEKIKEFLKEVEIIESVV